MFESTLGEGDRVSFRETILEEETGGVWGRQTLEARVYIVLYCSSQARAI